MTDFLEELLNGQVEEEEEEQGLLRPSRRLAQPAQMGGVRPEESVSPKGWADMKLADLPGKASPEWQRLTTEQRAVEASSNGLGAISAIAYAGDDSTSGTGVTNPPVYSLWEMVRRTYSAARLWQVRAVHQSGSIFETNGPTNRQIYGLHKQDSIVPGYAAQVDAVFARDARRYDGPLRIL